MLQGGIDLGRIAYMEKDHKAVDTAKKGDAVAMKIEVGLPVAALLCYPMSASASAPAVHGAAPGVA